MRCLFTSIVILAGLAAVIANEPDDVAVIANQPQRKYISMSLRGRFSCCLGEVIFIHSFIHSHIHTHIYIQSTTQNTRLHPPSILVPLRLCAFNARRRHRLLDTAHPLSTFLSSLPPPPPMACTSQCPSTRQPLPTGPHSAPRYVRLFVCGCVTLLCLVCVLSLSFSSLISPQSLSHHLTHTCIHTHAYKFFNTAPSFTAGTGGPNFGPLLDSVHFQVSEKLRLKRKRVWRWSEDVLVFVAFCFLYSILTLHTHTTTIITTRSPSKS